MSVSVNHQLPVSRASSQLAVLFATTLTSAYQLWDVSDFGPSWLVVINP